jgi:hypothetical protein
MTDVLEPVYVYARDPKGRRVVTICYTIRGNFAHIGVAMNHPGDCFEKKVGRSIARGRMEKSPIYFRLHYKKKRERLCEIVDRLTRSHNPIDQHGSRPGSLISSVVARSLPDLVAEHKVRTVRSRLGLPLTPETAFTPVQFQDILDEAVQEARDIENGVERSLFHLMSKGFEKVGNWLNGGKQ